MDYVIKILREVCEGSSYELRDFVDTDPEEGVYFVGNYKTHTNDRFTSLSAAKQHEASLKQSWQQEVEMEEARLAALNKSIGDGPADFIIESSYL